MDPPARIHEGMDGARVYLDTEALVIDHELIALQTPEALQDPLGPLRLTCHRLKIAITNQCLEDATALAQELAEHIEQQPGLRPLEQHRYELVMLAAITSSDPRYWDLIAPSVFMMIELLPAHLATCSLEFLAEMHRRDHLLEGCWVTLFRSAPLHVEMITRVQECWKIRLSPSGICTSEDRELIGEVLVSYFVDEKPYLSLPSRIQMIEALLQLYPEAIADHQARLLAIVLTPEQTDWDQKMLTPIPGLLLTWVIDFSGFDLSVVSSILPMVDQCIPECVAVALVAATKGCEIEYLYLPDSSITLLASWSRLPSRQIRGWSAFYYCGRYFYSLDLVLDLPNATFMYSLSELVAIASPLDSSVMPKIEHPIEIMVGREFDQPVTVPAPAILVHWYENYRSAKKSAASACVS